MSTFNPSEKFVAQLLSYLPGLKNIVKRGYQFANFFVYKKNYKFQSSYPVIAISKENEETFFGYYDKFPENSDGKYVIYQQSTYPTSKKPSSKYPIQIVVKDIKNQSECIIGESYSYNWQQGTKLQWLTHRIFIYNFFDEKSNAYKSRIFDVETRKELKVIDSPIYDCYKDLYALSLNYNRLNWLRPDYGYRNFKSKIDFSNNSNDGIFKIDLTNDTKCLLISIEDLINISPTPSMKNAKHKVNHIMISPDGTKFIFMHRWLIPGGKRVDRLLLSDVSGKNIKILVDCGMVSHCCWYGNNSIVGYFRYSTHGNSFYSIDIDKGTVTLLSNKLLPFGDGHPTIINNKMIFDSYPDRSRMKHLYSFDMEKDTIQEIGQFIEPLNYFGETRCDLHPKANGQSLYIDSVHEGSRGLYKISLKL